MPPANDINILAQKETNYNKTKTKRSRLLGLSKSSKTSTRKEELLRASNLNALEDDVDLLAQNNINIVGSNLNQVTGQVADVKVTSLLKKSQ